MVALAELLAWLAEVLGAEGLEFSVGSFIWSVLVSIAIAIATGGSIVFALTFGLFDDVILAFLGAKLTFLENVAVQVTLSELEHAVAQDWEMSGEDEETRNRRERWLERKNPHKTYLFGDFTLGQAEATAISIGYLAIRRVPDDVWIAGREWVEELLF